MNPSKALLILLSVVAISFNSFSQDEPRKIENVVYGMVSGTALLMDIYVPANPNHRAILFIPGSAWGFGYSLHYDETPLKEDIRLDSAYAGTIKTALVEKGYTVFVINHRFSPKFQYQDIIEDCRRAVRFIRYHAKKYNIDPNHMGAIGHSSGGNLASILGTTDSRYLASKSPVDSTSAKVQAVVTLAAPFNLADIHSPEDTTSMNKFLGAVIMAYMGDLPERKSGGFILSGKYRDASPFAMLSANDAPTLIYYSDDDPLIAPRQAEAMYKGLLQNKVPAKKVLSPNTAHHPLPDMTEVGNWFKKYLE